MLGDGSCRVLLYFLGYLCPAYSCFKALEQQQADKVRDWCIYWLLLALSTTVEKLVFDWLIFWVPLYYEAKVLFILYLWHPKTQGALYLYTAYVQPFLSDHEALVDEYVQEAKTRVSDFAAAHFQRFTQFLQSKAHLAISALQHAQQAKMEEVHGQDKQNSDRPAARTLAKTKSRNGSLEEEELPSVPPTKLE